MPLNEAVFESGRNKIFGVAGGYIQRFSALGFHEAQARFSVPDWGDTTLAYSGVDDKIYAANNLTYKNNSGDASRKLYRINPDSLAVEASWDQDSDLNVANAYDVKDGIRRILYINHLLYLQATGATFVVDPTAVGEGTFVGNTSFGASYVGLAAAGQNVIAGGNNNTTIKTAPADGTTSLSNGPYGPSLNVLGLAYSVHANSIYYAAYGQSIGKAHYPANDGGSNIDLGEATANPFNVRVNPYNYYVYIPLWGANKVAILDPRDDTFQLVSGFDSPYDVVFTTDRAFAVQHGAKGLKEIVATLSIIPAIVVPYGIPTGVSIGHPTAS